MPTHSLSQPVLQKIRPKDLTRATHTHLAVLLEKKGLNIVDEIADAYQILKYHEDTKPTERLQALLNIAQLCLSEKRLEQKAGASKAQVNILINNPAK